MNKREDIVEGAKFKWNSEPYDIVTITKVDKDTAYFTCSSDNYSSSTDLSSRHGWELWIPIKDDVVINPITPPHYNNTKIDALTVIDDWKLSFRLGNVLKYIQRHPHKGKPIEDLKKAAQYLALEIKKLEEAI